MGNPGNADTHKNYAKQEKFPVLGPDNAVQHLGHEPFYPHPDQKHYPYSLHEQPKKGSGKTAAKFSGKQGSKDHHGYYDNILEKQNGQGIPALGGIHLPGFLEEFHDNSGAAKRGKEAHKNKAIYRIIGKQRQK